MQLSFRYLILYVIVCVSLLIPAKTSELTLATPQLSLQEQHKIIQEYNCIKEALWFEARSEGVVGITAVMSVIHNRTQHKGYRDSYCGVIQQSRQFSYRNHLRKGQMMPVKQGYNAKEQQIVLQVQDIAFKAATGRFNSTLDDVVVMYHTLDLKNKPKWATNSKFSVRIGNHIFYKG